MLENLTSEQRKQLFKELKELGYDRVAITKDALFEKAMEENGLGAFHVCTDVRRALFLVADSATDNYALKLDGGKSARRGHCVSLEIEQQYKKIIGDMVRILKPYIETDCEKSWVHKRKQ